MGHRFVNLSKVKAPTVGVGVRQTYPSDVIDFQKVCRRCTYRILLNMALAHAANPADGVCSKLQCSCILPQITDMIV
jgi:hypothetical protein